MNIRTLGFIAATAAALSPVTQRLHRLKQDTLNACARPLHRAWRRAGAPAPHIQTGLLQLDLPPP